MVNRTFILIFYLVFSLFVQSAFTARFDESMNDFKQSVYNGAQTVKDSATSAGAYVKDKANHFMYAPGHAPAHAPLKAKNHHVHAPDVSSRDDKHNIVLHASKIPTYKDVTGDPKSAFKNWAYAPNPAAAPMTNKAGQMYHSAAGAVKDTGKKIHNTIHAAMSDVMHKSSKHHFSDVTGADSKTTYTNWAQAPTPAVAPPVHAVSGAAKKKIHNTIHTAMKGVEAFLPNTANTHFSDITGDWAHAPSYAPTPSATNAASRRIHKTIHTAMNDNMHMVKPTTFSDATGKTPASFHDWANSPSPLSAHAPRNSVSSAAGAVHKGAKKLHNTIHTSMKDKAKHHFNDITGRDPLVINDFTHAHAHAPAPSSYAAAPTKQAAKKIHYKIHAAMNEKARQILPNRGKHQYSDKTGVGTVDFSHAPAPAPTSHAVGSAKTSGKRIHNTIHATLNDKASKATKHQYGDKTGPGSVAAGSFAHAPTPAPHAAGAVKDAGKKLHKTVHAYMYNNNPDANAYNPYYNNYGRNNLNNGADGVQGHQEHYIPQTMVAQQGEGVADGVAVNP